MESTEGKEAEEMEEKKLEERKHIDKVTIK